MTQGLKDLLGSGLKQLAGQGGDPVVQLQTNFGGGKTHSMMALWHLFSGVAANELQDVNDLLSEYSSEIAENVNRAVFVGTKDFPGSARNQARRNRGQNSLRRTRMATWREKKPTHDC